VTVGAEPTRLSSIWLVTTGEPLPSDGPGTRLLRTGIFFEDLVARGVRTHWWTSGFDHHRRTQRSTSLARLEVGSVGTITLIPSPGYRGSVSIRRLVDHATTARRFRDAATEAAAPQLIWCSYPTVELSAVSVELGKRWGIPVVLDVRDLWPDVIWDTVLPGSPALARDAALRILRRPAARAIRAATAVVGLTDEYVAWALELAGRARNEHDVAIPVTYPDPVGPLTPSEIAEGERLWGEHGVDLGEDWIVCFLGTLGRQFDFGPVLDAAGRLRSGAPKVRFVLAGAGEGLESLRSRAAGLSNVVVPGWVDGVRRRTLLSRSKLGLAPYRPSENFLRNLPNKPVEYFAHGLPVLYPIEGVLHRACQRSECGLRYGGGEALASILEEIRRDDARHDRMAKNARRLFLDDFAREAVTDRLVGLCERILGAA
jgi:glycosyltransferase involved in cell wall biosynthesis